MDTADGRWHDKSWPNPNAQLDITASPASTTPICNAGPTACISRCSINDLFICGENSRSYVFWPAKFESDLRRLLGLHKQAVCPPKMPRSVCTCHRFDDWVRVPDKQHREVWHKFEWHLLVQRTWHRWCALPNTGLSGRSWVKVGDYRLHFVAVAAPVHPPRPR